MLVRRGDTIVEVLFAITIFSMIAVAAVSLMNKGLATSQRSLEITTVRQQIDGQAEALRFMHAAYVNSYKPGATYEGTSPQGRYQSILAMARSAASPFGEVSECTQPTGGAFVIDPRTGRVESSVANLHTAPFVPQLVYNGDELGYAEGLWVEPVRSSAASTGTSVGYMDYHIRACWNTPGQTEPMTLGTIVRLYDPR